MKVLTMCQGGNVRSVSLAWLLKYKYGHDALACSWERNTASTITMLGDWADYIVILQKNMKEHLPHPWTSKLLCYDVGPDRWGNCFHPELTNILDSIIQRHGLFIDIRSHVNDNSHPEPDSLSRDHV